MKKFIIRLFVKLESTLLSLEKPEAKDAAYGAKKEFLHTRHVLQHMAYVKKLFSVKRILAALAIDAARTGVSSGDAVSPPALS